MFSIFKKKEERLVSELKAIVTGKVIPLEEVPDETFASKLLGDGVAFVPEDDVIVSPCDCTVVTMNEAMKHACGLKLENDLELLIHVGIDTVRLQGEGFKQLVKEGSKVKAGEPLLKFDRDIIKNNDFSDYIMMIITELGNINNDYSMNFGDVIKGENIVIEWNK